MRVLKGFSRFLEESSFIRHYLWRFRGKIAIGLLALLLVDLLEIIPPLLIKEAIEVLEEGRPMNLIAQFAIGYLGVYLVQFVGRYLWRVYLSKTSMIAGKDLRRRFSNHLFRMSSSFFDRKSIGDLMSLATNDTEAVRMAIGPGFIILVDCILLFLTVFVAMLMLSYQLTLVLLVPLLLIPLFVHRNERKVQKRFEQVQAAFSRLAALAQENITGIRLVKGFANEDAQIHRFRDLGREYIKLNLALSRVQVLFDPMMDFIVSLGLVLLVYWGSGWVLDDTITLGTFVAFQRYLQKMIWPMMALAFAVVFYQRAVASSKRLKEVFGTQTDIREDPKPLLPVGFTGRSKGLIEFRGAAFRYPGAERHSLYDVNLRFEPGQRTAILGMVGSGKSTLLRLIPRLYPIEDGMVFLDGLDINRWPIEELRHQIGYVGQDVFLFSRTLIENVAFGIRAGEAKQDVPSDKAFERAKEAIELAAMNPSISRLPAGYETILGERGVNLSGGQKQRLTIARALVRDPAVLILDDALSAVDMETEEKILSGLRERQKTKGHRDTEIMTAHRISTIMDADQIIVLEQGRVVQRGTHRSLIQERGSLYWRFYEKQRLREELERYLGAEAMALMEKSDQ